jgi:hypothetical protein
MKKFVLVVVMTLFMQGCISGNAEKYELKSPCVTADSISFDYSQPCSKRSPANQHLV